MRRDVRVALRWVWAILSVGVLAVLLAPQVAGQDAVRRWTPLCVRRTTEGRECSLCGMTTAFLAISRGDVAAAERANRGGVPLYGSFVLNELIFGVCLGRRLRCRRSV